MKFMKTLDKVWGPNGSCGIPTDDLTASQQDELFTYQLAQKNPHILTEDSLIMTEICASFHPAGLHYFSSPSAADDYAAK